ncbi:unnamed protein product [Rotaria magnacalcarata]|uniref:Uncharacterized protein n=2 Tax=Rotaria TaxID=231623 RepID=A0A815B8T9_9BILA|nr:unnamed protein product [Rotaria magnacalcarata]CAF1677058.1 unnamed protein product [Rotaria magnacalcarata]CAF2048413.1 unnamed protein product [Rotaria magnacalcarata]CAF2084082.1 unnamed protein product [Rotaria magnacalcarata]CAF2134217.1 unnamed protein product [Rotaria magnacalcarata]
MKHSLNGKVWANRSQQALRNPTMPSVEFQTRLTKTVDHFGHVSVQPIKLSSQAPPKHHDEYTVVDKVKEAQTGKWVLHVIEGREDNGKPSIANNNFWYADTKQESNQSSSQFVHTKLHKMRKKYSKNQNENRLPNETIINPAAIHNGRPTPLSRFSSATQVHDIESLETSMGSPRVKSISGSGDCSTEEFRDSDKNTCISKRVLIIITIVSILLVIGIFVALFVTIFVVRRGSTDSTDSSGKSSELKLISIPLSSASSTLCSMEMFNITDPLCTGQVSYNFFSCYQMATSTSFTIRFTFQHDIESGHWYFDDISAVQNNSVQLITNGGFEANLTGWVLNISLNSTPDTYVDTTTGLAHTGNGYLYGASKYYPTYVQQIFNVVQNEYIEIGFWWKYDGGSKLGSTCTAIGQLIPSL